MSNNAAERELRAVAMGRRYTAAAPTEALDTSDAALIQSIAAGDKGAMRIFPTENCRANQTLSLTRQPTTQWSKNSRGY